MRAKKEKIRAREKQQRERAGVNTENMTPEEKLLRAKLIKLLINLFFYLLKV